jgi:hypothetical protein
MRKSWVIIRWASRTPVTLERVGASAAESVMPEGCGDALTARLPQPFGRPRGRNLSEPVDRPPDGRGQPTDIVFATHRHSGVDRRSTGSPPQHAGLVALRIGEHDEPLRAGLSDCGCRETCHGV